MDNDDHVNMDNRHQSDDNLGSCGSVDEAKTPDDDSESLNQSLSSPGCLSGLSSLQSPSTSLASPLNLLASPATPTTFSEQQALEQTMNHLNNLKKEAAAAAAAAAEEENESNRRSRLSSMSKGLDHHSHHHHQHKSSGSTVNVPEKHHPPDVFDRLGIIKPPPPAPTSSANINNPQHPAHPLNINNITRRDFNGLGAGSGLSSSSSTGGSPIFQRKNAPYNGPLPPPPTPLSAAGSPSLSPITFSSSPPTPNQFHLHQQFSAAAAAAAAFSNHLAQSHHNALHNLHLQQSLAHGMHFAQPRSAAAAVVSQTPTGSRSNDPATSENGAISVT